MPAPQTVFDSPFPLQPDERGARFYGNVDNRLEVTDGDRHWHVAVAVPTELFTYMREVMKVPPEETVTLALDRDEDHYVFSALAGDTLHDLWSYSRASVPGWLLAPAYRLKSLK